MKLKKLDLSHFRSYQARVFDFSEPTTILVGPNASGKTSVIEAINLLTTGDSFRATKIDQMISFGAELGRVKAVVEIEAEELELEVLLTRGKVQGRRTRKRHYSINETKRSKAKFTGQLLAVVFRPEDLRLIEGSTRRRRDFLDTPLSLISNEYQRSLKVYSQALTKRNKLLTQIREGEMPHSTLTYWTMTILKHGQLVQEKRRQFLETFSQVDFSLPFSVEYDASIINEARLEKYADREVAAGYTLVGPHKDDFLVKLAVSSESRGEEQRDIALYGSRGQQRLGVLWLKTCELAYLETERQQKPLLLLDDILSELDAEHRQLVMSLLDGHQVIITTAAQNIAQKIQAERSNSVMIDLS